VCVFRALWRPHTHTHAHLFFSCSVTTTHTHTHTAFLKENSKKEGVITLPSGLQYKVLKKGSGAYHPTVDSRCSCHYHGTLIDGSVFDSSVERGSPSDFAPNQVIKGWTEAMQLMVEGDKFELYIPSELAYGERGSPPKIQGGAALIFTIEMIEIKGAKVPAMTCDAKTLNECTERETKYIAKKSTNSISSLKKETERLQKMLQKKMSEKSRAWINRRLHVLPQLISISEKQEQEEL
jgi:FKBP-type peptidyl-prolyl cis-trans isomerase FklB